MQLTSEEDSIRQSIADIVNNSDKDVSCSPHDFEFVKRCSHSFRIPDVLLDFKYDIEALKTLIGQGDIYVRLTKDILIHHSDSAEEGCSVQSSPSVSVTPVVSHSTSGTGRRRRLSLSSLQLVRVSKSGHQIQAGIILSS